MPSPAPVIVCECGFRLRAAGAVPGRVGRCPRCKATIRFPEPQAPEPDPEPEPEGVEEAPAAPARSKPRVFTEGATRQARPERRSPATGSGNSYSESVVHPTLRATGAIEKFKDGLIEAPKALETSLFGSLLYPFWGAAGVQMLTFVPGILWLGSMPVLVLGQAVNNSPSYRLPAYVLMLPFSALSMYLLGYLLYFLGEVLTSSSCGEIQVPRKPPWEVETIRRCVSRWIVSLFLGLGAGWLPASAYWVEFGANSVVDRIIITNLMMLGGAYSLMALLASLLFDDPLAANPFTVFPALRRAGWAFVNPCLLTAGAGSVLYWLLDGVVSSGNAAVAGFGLLVFWVAAIYVAIVLFRRIGLFCHERRVRDLWFPDRPMVGRVPR